MASEPIDWWVRKPSDWRELDSIPTGEGGPFVLANADKSKTWLSMDGEARDSDEGDAPAYWARA